MMNLMIWQSIHYLKNNIFSQHGKFEEQRIILPQVWGNLPLYLKHSSLLVKIASKFRFYALEFIRQITFNDFWVNLPCCPHFEGTVTPEFNEIAWNLNKTLDKLNRTTIDTLQPENQTSNRYNESFNNNMYLFNSGAFAPISPKRSHPHQQSIEIRMLRLDIDQNLWIS